MNRNIYLTATCAESKEVVATLHVQLGLSDGDLELARQRVNDVVVAQQSAMERDLARNEAERRVFAHLEEHSNCVEALSALSLMSETDATVAFECEQ